MSDMDHAAEARRLIESHERTRSQASPSTRAPMERTIRVTHMLDPHTYTADDATAIDGLLPDGHGAELGERRQFEPGYCYCCDGPCRRVDG